MSVFLFAAAFVWLLPQDPRFEVKGLPWLDENKGELIRLPQRLKEQLPPAVWQLGLSPSGGRIRFRTNSTRIAIRLAYPSPPAMANMHAFGQTGVDLYVNGTYRSTAIAPKDASNDKIVEHVYFENLPKQDRDLTFYLPLYKPVRVIGIGIDDDAVITKAPAFAISKPVVFYGTSITQGGCASRPGLSYQAILGRRLNLDFVNLGFSGNGKGEPVVAKMTAEIDASAFVLDFSQNNPTVESLQEVYEPFLAAVRAKHPGTPIIAITAISASRETPRLDGMRRHVREVVNRKISEGDRRLILVEGTELLGPSRLDGLVDGVHPNDLGFQWMADGLAPHLAKALRLPPADLHDDRALQASAATAQSVRERLIRYIWGDPGIPKNKPAAIERNAQSPIAGLQHAGSVDTFTIRMEAGEQNTTHHFVPRVANGGLVILHHGHACTFDDAGASKSYGMANTVDALLGAGYAVLTAYMPHMRPGDCGTVPHANIFDIPVQNGSPLKFFLEPVAVSLNEIAARYKRIHMAGLSGGGWTTTVYAVLDTRIRSSFPIAGTMPLYLRTGGSVGDLEQYLEPFYRIAGYPDLYLLGSVGKNRRQIQILIRRDDCCFGELQHQPAKVGLNYEAAIRAYEAVVQKAAGKHGSFRVEVDSSAPRHMISPQTTATILRELKTHP